MLIVDSQVHLWGASTPERPWPNRGAAHRPVPISKDSLSQVEVYSENRPESRKDIGFQGDYLPSVRIGRPNSISTQLIATRGDKAPALSYRTFGSTSGRRLRRSAMQSQSTLGVGVETVGSSPAQFAATIRSEMSRMGKVIKDAGIRAD